MQAKPVEGGKSVLFEDRLVRGVRPDQKEVPPAVTPPHLMRLMGSESRYVVPVYSVYDKPRK